MLISELSRRTGVSLHRLRRYEADGLLVASRTAGGYRDYPEQAVREVTFIAMGRDLGFGLQGLAALMPRYRAGTLSIDEMIDHLRARIDEIDALIASQKQMRRRLVAHIGWFEERRRKAASKTPASRFPRPSHRTKPP